MTANGDNPETPFRTEGRFFARGCVLWSWGSLPTFPPIKGVQRPPVAILGDRREGIALCLPYRPISGLDKCTLLMYIMGVRMNEARIFNMRDLSMINFNTGSSKNWNLIGMKTSGMKFSEDVA